ncbi:hypothetical protein QFZ58_000238 [Streptomyces sp. B1I3]|nr:hypothetical protein [Streptomyces sp. B1I3]
MKSEVNEVLLRRLTPSVLAILVRRGADFAAAEDAVQDALVEAVHIRPAVQDAESAALCRPPHRGGHPARTGFGCPCREVATTVSGAEAR